jgi:chromosome segregation ATPase
MSTQSDEGDRATPDGSSREASATGAGGSPKRGSPEAESVEASPTSPGDKGQPKQPNGAAPDTLAEFLAEIRTRQSDLTTTIEQTKAALADEVGQQQKLKKQVTDLDRATGDLDRARADSATVLESADEALAAAEPIIGELDDKVEKDLAQKFAGIDKAIDDKRADADARRAEVPALQAAWDSAHRAWTEQQTAYDERTADLTGLPAVIKQLTARLKALLGDLVAATTARNAVKACVQALEVKAAKSALEARRDPAHEATLIAAVQGAEKSLSDARTTLVKAKAALGEKQAAVQTLDAELAQLEKARAAAVKKLYDVPSDPSHAALQA